MRRSASIILALIALTAATAGLAGRTSPPTVDPTSNTTYAAVLEYVSSLDRKPRVARIEVEFDEGAHDVPLQARRAEAIFVGTVVGIDRVTTRYSIDDAWTVFDIAVEDIVKGEPGETAQITQWGGYNPERHLWVFISGDVLLRVDETYLFLATPSLIGSPPEFEGLWFMPHGHNVGHTRVSNRASRQHLIREFSAYVAAEANNPGLFAPSTSADLERFPETPEPPTASS